MEFMWMLNDTGDDYQCADKGMLLPLISEKNWLVPVRAFLYLIGLIWCFAGLAIISDTFMCAIERITHQTRTIQTFKDDKEVEHSIIVEYRIWNDTVANLTLMALGSSAPEILLAVVGILGNGMKADKLGPSTIVGSAAFNLFVISAVCVISIPSTEIRRIKEFRVFLITAFSAIFAYVWLLLILVVITPGFVDIWEALITLCFFPIMVILAYLADKMFFLKRKSKTTDVKQINNDPEIADLDDDDPDLEDWVLRLIAQYPDLEDSKIARLVVSRLISKDMRSVLYYRIKGARQMGGCQAEDLNTSHITALVRNINIRAEVINAQTNKVVPFIDRYYNEEGVPSEIQFIQSKMEVHEGDGHACVWIMRSGNMKSVVRFRLQTFDGTAIGQLEEQEYTKDYISQDKEMIFLENEAFTYTDIKVLPDDEVEPDEVFYVKLMKLSNEDNVTLGHNKVMEVTLIDDTGLQNKLKRIYLMVKKDLEDRRIYSSSYGDQFRNAMNVRGGDLKNATHIDYFMHFVTFAWKILFALIPSPIIWGGWLAFFLSLIMIGGLVVIISDLATIFGCLVGLDDTITAITFVALGTSLPDLFASKHAARQEETADNSIGNVTGSNSVNVFLGLGLPWVIASVYWTIKGERFSVPADSLSFSVVIYVVFALICIAVLIIRRSFKPFGRGELGGNKTLKISTFVLFVFLWLAYILLSSLQVYGFIPVF